MTVKRITSVQEAQEELDKATRRVSRIVRTLRTLRRLFSLSFLRRSTTTAATDDNEQAISVRDSGQKTGLGSIDIDIKALYQNFELLAQLEQEHRVVKNIVVNLENNIKESPAQTRTLNSANSLLKTIEKDLAASHAAMGKLAALSQSPVFNGIVKAFNDNIQEKLGQQCKGIKLFRQVAPVQNKLHHVAYFRLEKLTNQTGYVFPEYFIVVTDVLTPAANTTLELPKSRAKTLPRTLHGEHTYYLNIMNRMALPGKYRLNKSSAFTRAPKGLEILEELLRLDSLSLQLARNPVPIKNARLIDPSIEKITVGKEQLSVTLKSGVNDAKRTALAEKLLGQIRSQVLKVHSRNQDLIVYRFVTVGGRKLIVFEFHRPSDYTGKVIDATGYRRMAELFNLSDDEVKRIRDALDAR